MRRDTFEQALRLVCRAAPFRTFTVELVGGERLIGYHPELFDTDGDLYIYELTEATGIRTYFDSSCVARVVNIVIPPGEL